MKTIEAIIDDIEYQLKSKGQKYYDRISIACFTNEPIVIDHDDISLPQHLTVKQRHDVISEAIRRIFTIVHQSYCKEPHILSWRYGQFEGKLATDLPQKVWVKGSRHQIRRFTL
jgi:hypothetical protein